MAPPHLTNYALLQGLQGLPERRRRWEVQDLGAVLLVLAVPSLSVLVAQGLIALRGL